MDGLCLLAARLGTEPLLTEISTFRRPVLPQGAAGQPARPEARAASRRGAWKTAARGRRRPFPTVISRADQKGGQGRLRRNGKTIKAPGEARPPRALPTPFGDKRR